jgi:hypothetical protein
MDRALEGAGRRRQGPSQIEPCLRSPSGHGQIRHEPLQDTPIFHIEGRLQMQRPRQRLPSVVIDQRQTAGGG